MRKYALLAAAALLIVIIAITGCGRGGGSNSSLAEINGQTISYADFAKQMATTPMAASVLDQMLESRMILSLAEKNGVSPTDEQINQQTELIKKVNGGNLDEFLKQQNMTLDEYKDKQRVQQATANLAEKLSKTKVTDAEIKAQYDTSKIGDVPERMRTELAIFQTKAAAEKAVKDTEAGTAFDKAAASAGVRASTQLLPKSGLPADVQKAVFNTPIGKFSNVVTLPGNGQSSYAVFRPLSTVPAVKISLKEAEPILKAQLYLQKVAADQDFQKTISDAHKDAKITINLEALKPAEKDFRNPPQMPQGMPMMRPVPKGAK